MKLLQIQVYSIAKAIGTKQFLYIIKIHIPGITTVALSSYEQELPVVLASKNNQHGTQCFPETLAECPTDNCNSAGCYNGCNDGGCTRMGW